MGWRSALLGMTFTFAVGLFLGNQMYTPEEIELEETVAALRNGLRQSEALARQIIKQLREVAEEKSELVPQVAKLKEENAGLREQLSYLNQRWESVQPASVLSDLESVQSKVAELAELTRKLQEKAAALQQKKQ
jgi:uncharacterized coiled-coil DUF342 family protein